MMQDTVEEYIAALPEERKALLSSLHRLILKLYPDAVVDLSYKMPTYRWGEGWVALASQKHYLSLYTCGAHHLQRFKQQHPAIKTGKGCINFNPKQAIPYSDVEQVIRHAMDHPKG